jgi:hypothetical protein
VTDTEFIARFLMVFIPALLLGVGGIVYGYLTRDRAAPPSE